MSSILLCSATLAVFLLVISFASCSPLSYPVDRNSYQRNDPYSVNIDDDYNNKYYIDDNDRPLAMFTRDLISARSERSPVSYYPRASRNSWFRVSTYQHLKPSGFENEGTGDKLLRWGR